MNIFVCSCRWHWMVNVDLLTINVHCHPSILGELGAELRYSAMVLLSGATTPVTITVVIGPGVPSGLCETIAIVLNDVHFHAGWLHLSLDVAIICRLEVAWIRRNEVEVVVHSCVSSRGVHLKFNVPSKQVEGLLSMNTTTSGHRPASLAIPVSIAALNYKVILGWTIQISPCQA